MSNRDIVTAVIIIIIIVITLKISVSQCELVGISKLATIDFVRVDYARVLYTMYYTLRDVLKDILRLNMSFRWGTTEVLFIAKTRIRRGNLGM